MMTMITSRTLGKILYNSRDTLYEGISYSYDIWIILSDSYS